MNVRLTKKKIACDNFLQNSSNLIKDSWKVINFSRNKYNLSSPDCFSSEEFSQYFCSIADNIINSLNVGNFNSFSFNNIPQLRSSFFLSPVTANDISQAINKLKNSACPDFYGINSKLLKESINIIFEPLIYLFNLCINEGNFPDAFKISIVLPLFKKGDTSNIDNYRPIAIIPIFSKIFEIILKDKIYKYLDMNNCFHCCQFGFRTRCSTTQAILKVVSSVVEALENGEHVSLSLCDLSKAFDCVSFDILISKLQCYGIRGLPLKLFTSYLRDRQQCVSVNGNLSELAGVSHGVPQGSVLGPLLFIIYINDLIHYLHPNTCIAYADDTSLLVSDRDLASLSLKVESVMQRSKDWFTGNKLKLNSDKTQSLLISTHRNITSHNSVKLLGIFIDDNLNWKSHVDFLGKKLAKTLFLLKNLKPLCNLQTLRMCYFALFHSHLMYGTVLWGNSTNSGKIFRLQKKAVRTIAGMRTRDHCKPVFCDLGIMPLPSVFIYSTLLEIHKNIDRYTLNGLHEHETRHSKDIRVPFHRLTISKRNSLSVDIYNHLPLHFRNLNFETFKLRIKKHILNYCFYSVEEFKSISLSTLV